MLPYLETQFGGKFGENSESFERGALFDWKVLLIINNFDDIDLPPGSVTIHPAFSLQHHPALQRDIVSQDNRSS
jgi:hypothetical protein